MKKKPSRAELTQAIKTIQAAFGGVTETLDGPYLIVRPDTVDVINADAKVLIEGAKAAVAVDALLIEFKP